MSRHKATTAAAADKKDVYTRVTERIIADLEQGVRTWLKPWLTCRLCQQHQQNRDQ